MKFRIALTGFLLCFTLAHAQPTNLDCTYHEAGSVTSLPMTFDESAGTASLGNQPSAHATFTETQITWEVNQEKDNMRFWYTLSRTTGELNERVQGKKSGRDSFVVWQCSVAQKKF